MKTNVARRRTYRRALIDAEMVRPDRFTDMIRAVTGGGTRSCASCGLVRVGSALDDQDVCTACRQAFGRLRARAPQPLAVVTPIEPNVVWVDASYNRGRAGLAVVGALGEHSRSVASVSSVQAEVLALRWAMEIARAGDVCGLTFRTDCQAAYNVLRQTPERMYWTVEQVPRRENRRADFLAGRARTMTKETT